jgi:hypothetical protein
LVEFKLNLTYRIKRCPVFSCESQYDQKWEFKDTQHNQKLVQPILVSEGILTVDHLQTFVSPPTGYAGARARKGVLKQLRSKAWWECRMLTELGASLQAKLLKHHEKKTGSYL